ncbi:hypothetical protein AB4Y76_20120, partial [Marmoricola sp. RAF53]
MSPEQPNARPSQVTVAGWAVAAAAVVLVVAVFDQMARLHTVDMREDIARVISSGSAADLGLTVARATEILRWILMVSAVAAVAAGVFGVFVLQRHRAARIGLTVAAVPVVLTAPVAGSLPAMVIGAGAALLWSRPARDWFAGRPAQARPEPVTRAARPNPFAAPVQRPVDAPVTTPVQRPPAELPPPDPGTPPVLLPPPTSGWGGYPPGPAYPPHPAHPP